MRSLVSLCVAASVLLAGCSAPVQKEPLPTGGPTPGQSKDGAEDQPDGYVAFDLDGEPVPLSNYSGDVVLLYVWATWCTICRGEGPEIKQIHEWYHEEGLEVLAVSIDRQGAQQRIQETADDRGYPFVLLHDPEYTASGQFGVRYQPNSILIDRNGTVVETWHGRITGGAEGARDTIESVL